MAKCGNTNFSFELIFILTFQEIKEYRKKKKRRSVEPDPSQVNIDF